MKWLKLAEPDDLGHAASAVAFDPAAEIASLRDNGADRMHPVRFHFIASLSARAMRQQGTVKRLLDDKLAAALTAYRARFEQAQDDASKAITCLEKNETRPSLTELTRYLAQLSPESIDSGPEGAPGGRSELKTIRHFRNTWAKLSVDKQLAQAIEQAPENAGPINSHRLVLRSLALMRDISPDYLNRFMSYADTLLWLEQADSKNKPPVKKPTAAKLKKK